MFFFIFAFLEGVFFSPFFFNKKKIGKKERQEAAAAATASTTTTAATIAAATRRSLQHPPMVHLVWGEDHGRRECPDGTGVAGVRSLDMAGRNVPMHGPWSSRTKSVCPAPKWGESVCPAPRRGKLERPAPKRGEPERPTPKKGGH